MKSLSRVRLLATPWTAAHQAPLSMGFSRQEYWSGVPLPSPFPILHYLPKFAQSHVHCVEDAIQPSHPVAPFSSCLQSFAASGSFPMNRLFASGNQSIGASSSASVLPYKYSGLISFRIHWFDLLAVQGILKSPHHSLKASVLWH